MDDLTQETPSGEEEEDTITQVHDPDEVAKGNTEVPGNPNDKDCGDLTEGNRRPGGEDDVRSQTPEVCDQWQQDLGVEEPTAERPRRTPCKTDVRHLRGTPLLSHPPRRRSSSVWDTNA